MHLFIKLAIGRASVRVWRTVSESVAPLGACLGEELIAQRRLTDPVTTQHRV